MLECDISWSNKEGNICIPNNEAYVLSPPSIPTPVILIRLLES